MPPPAGAGAAGEAIVVMAEIAGAYGVRGWVKAKPFTREARTLLDYSTWWLQRARGGEWTSRAVHEAREHGGGVVARIDGVESREAAIALAGARIGVPRERMPEPAQGEVYHADLVGLDVVNRAGVRLGRVDAVQEFGAHPVLRVVDEASRVERLIPFVAAYVDAVDVASRRIDIDWEADY